MRIIDVSPIGIGVLNVYSVEEVRQRDLSAFDIEYVRRFLREHILENRNNEPRIYK